MSVRSSGPKKTIRKTLEEQMSTKKVRRTPEQERAMPDKKPISSERVMRYKQTKRSERVTACQETTQSERASHRENTRQQKRATYAENTRLPKRAIREENPNIAERPDIEPDSDSEPDTRPLALILGRTFQSIQRLRVGLELSLQHRENVPQQTLKILADLQAAENGFVDILSLECKASSIWPWLSGVKGIGPRLGGMLVALVDVHKAPTISSLWKFAGQAVTNGVCDKREKGVKLPYCDALKKTCYLIGDQFIKQNTQPYRQVYDEAKEFYLRTKPEWQQNPKAPKKHCEMAARRKMVKRFLSDLWIEWRRAEGLPVTEPYVVAYLGHKISQEIR